MAIDRLSVKGVLLHRGRVLLLSNRRGEWDLPGGQPDPGEEPRATVVREVREETGLAVEVGLALEPQLFEVLPGRTVRILPFLCLLREDRPVVLSDEHLASRWLPLAEVAAVVDGLALPACYRAAIRQAADQVPPSSSDRSA